MDDNTPEYFIKVRAKASTPAEVAARQERLRAYFAGETTDRGKIENGLPNGEPKAYSSSGRRIMGRDLLRGPAYAEHYWAMAQANEPTPLEQARLARQVKQLRLQAKG